MTANARPASERSEVTRMFATKRVGAAGAGEAARTSRRTVDVGSGGEVRDEGAYEVCAGLRTARLPPAGRLERHEPECHLAGMP